MAGLTFSMGKPQLEKALYNGMTLREDGTVVSGTGEGPFSCMFDVLDSGVEDCAWGRLRLRLTLPENGVCYLYAAACNEADQRAYLMDPKVSFTEKKRCLSGIRCLRFTNRQDVLLYEIEGRYLWIAVEVIGGGAAFSDVKVYVPGDSFMEVFPEVYREKNSFFHRYLSIYSAIYDDFQDELERRADLLDAGKAPEKLLELFLKWIGIDVNSGYLEEECLRRLLQEAPTLIRYKGSAKCIRLLCRLFLGEEPTILERGLMKRYGEGIQQEVYDSLYGDDPYDVTLLLAAGVEEQKKKQLLHLLEQFKPVRSRLRILFTENSGVLDEHTYLDWNAVVFSREEGRMDCSMLTDGAIILE